MTAAAFSKVEERSHHPLDDIEEVKTYYPSEDEFKEPMKYIEHLFY